jgi:hypothetical protein
MILFDSLIICIMTTPKQFFKYSIITLVLMVFILPLKAQTPDSLVNLPNLLFPKFSWGIVKLKTGDKNKAMLNYNTVTQELVFMQKKEFLVLDNPQDIDTVYLWNKIFIPFEKTFYELAVMAPIQLFIQHKSYVVQPGVPTGFGATSQTAGPTSVARYYGARGPIDLKLPKDYKVIDDTEYWIKKEGQMVNFDTKNKFLKIFPDKKDELSKFIKQRGIDFEKPEKVVELVVYCNELYK